jgi:hypothetical protein
MWRSLSVGTNHANAVKIILSIRSISISYRRLQLTMSPTTFGSLKLNRRVATLHDHILGNASRFRQRGNRLGLDLRRQVALNFH